RPHGGGGALDVAVRPAVRTRRSRRSRRPGRPWGAGGAIDTGGASRSGWSDGGGTDDLGAGLADLEDDTGLRGPVEGDGVVDQFDRRPVGRHDIEDGHGVARVTSESNDQVPAARVRTSPSVTCWRSQAYDPDSRAVASSSRRRTISPSAAPSMSMSRSMAGVELAVRRSCEVNVRADTSAATPASLMVIGSATESPRHP